MHIKEINSSISFSYNNNSDIIYYRREENINIISIKSIESKVEGKYNCKICEDDISKEEEIKNRCEQCNNYFCSECLYLHIKELIRNGKYSLFCPECKFVYTKDKIEEILLFNIKDKEEINQLKTLLERINVLPYS